MHCLAMHVSEFLKLYGNIGQFTQQGLENLMTSQQYSFSMQQTIMNKKR